MVSCPPVTRLLTLSARFNTRVSGPGQKRRKRVCGVRNIARPFRELSRIRYMHDEGVIVRAPLGREDLPYRGVIGGIRAEAIHGFGRKGDEPARAQQDHPTVDVRV